MNTSIFTDPSTGQRYLVVAIQTPAGVPPNGPHVQDYAAAWAGDVGNWLDLTRAHTGPPEPTPPELGELHDAGPWLANLASRCRRRTASKNVWLDKCAQAERRAEAAKAEARELAATVKRLLAEAEPWAKAVQQRDARYLEAKEEARVLAKELGEMGKACDQAGEMMAAKRKSADEELEIMATAVSQARELLQLIREHNPDLKMPSAEALKMGAYYKARHGRGLGRVAPQDGGPYCGVCGGTREVAEHECGGAAVGPISVPQRTGRMIACPTCRPDGEQQAEPSEAV